LLYANILSDLVQQIMKQLSED